MKKGEQGRGKGSKGKCRLGRWGELREGRKGGEENRLECLGAGEREGKQRGMQAGKMGRTERGEGEERKTD